MDQQQKACGRKLCRDGCCLIVSEGVLVLRVCHATTLMLLGLHLAVCQDPSFATILAASRGLAAACSRRHQWQVQTFMHGVTMQDPDGFIEHGGWNFLDAEGDGSDEEGDDEEEEGEQSSPSCSGDQRLSSVPTADSRDEEGAASPSVSWLCCLKDPMECRLC